MDVIDYTDFAKVQIRMGLITAAEVPDGSEKVIKLTVNFGDEMGMRTIFGGIKQWYAPEEMVGKALPFVVNLAPKKMGSLGFSEGMLVAVITGDEGDEKAVLLEPREKVKPGDKVV